MQKNLHPKWFAKTFVYCDNSLIKITSSTQSKMYVERWSGNHPFFNKSKTFIPIKGQIDRFLTKYKY